MTKSKDMLSNYDNVSFQDINYESNNTPIISNPYFLIDNKIHDIGERLLDFIPKMIKHFMKSKGVGKLIDPSPRVFQYAVLQDVNKFYEIALVTCDIDPNRLFKIKKFISEELNTTQIQISNNFMWIHWDNGYDNILKIAEIVLYLGTPEFLEFNHKQ